ncbi:MAG: right-handed parallel beta-helix repeat-containing protein, partial [Thermoplasmatota archaeon]
MRSGKVSQVLLVLSLLIIGTILVYENGPEAASGIAWAPGDSIKIDSDADLISQAASNGWPGSGTESDPYRIENLTITGKTTNGIDISNTELYIVINNCTLSKNNGHDIYLSICSNLTIVNCSLFNTTTAINIGGGNNILIINNTLVSHRYGMRMSSVSDLIISGNQMLNPDDKGETGLYSWDINRYLIRDNEISNHTDYGMFGFFFGSGRISNNSFIRNVRTGICPNSGYEGSTLRIDNNTCHSNYVGIGPWNIASIIAENNTCYNNSIGLGLGGVHIVKDNTIYQNEIGLRIESGVKAYDNDVFNNLKDGIQVEGGSNEVFGNEVKNNGRAGIFVRSRPYVSDSHIIHDNVVEGNMVGIYLNDTNDDQVHNNTVKNNKGPAIQIVKGSRIGIIDNTILSSSEKGITASSISYLTLWNNSITTHNKTALSIDGATYLDVIDNMVKVDEKRAVEVTNCAIIAFKENTVEGGSF